jgi:glycosyltransferase 2 family protein
LGQWLEVWGFRFRIYTGWGVTKKVISKIVFFSTVTNWSGNALLLSTFFCFRSQEVYELIGVPIWILKTLGMIEYGVLFTYLVFCFRRSVITFKGNTFTFPTLSLAFFQFFLSIVQWSLLSTIIYILIRYLGHDVALEQIIFTSLIASVAGVLTHIPGGLGVLETIFLKVDLGVPASDMLAVLIAYRVVYYFIPLMIAIPTYLSLEYHQKKNIRKRNIQ